MTPLEQKAIAFFAGGDDRRAWALPSQMKAIASQQVLDGMVEKGLLRHSPFAGYARGEILEGKGSTFKLLETRPSKYVMVDGKRLTKAQAAHLEQRLLELLELLQTPKTLIEIGAVINQTTALDYLRVLKARSHVDQWKSVVKDARGRQKLLWGLPEHRALESQALVLLEQGEREIRILEEIL